MDDGSRQKVWILASLSIRFFEHCFHAGAQHVLALVTGTHRKGYILEAANSWRIAVVKPLYRLYTMILNKRLAYEHGSVFMSGPFAEWL